MINTIRRHPVRTAVGVLTIIVALSWVAFGFFGVHTLFVDDVVAEAAPEFDAPPVVDQQDRPSTSPAAPADATPPTPDGADAPTDTEAGSVEAASEVSAAAGSVLDESNAASSSTAADGAVENDATTPTGSAPAPAGIVTEYGGSFVSEAHPTSGSAIVLGNGTGQRFLRFEDFETDNGPDLNVYLRDPRTGDFVDLGDLKGNIGEQNYEIPVDVDLARFSEVDVWCVRFGVGFGSATLTPTG